MQQRQLVKKKRKEIRISTINKVVLIRIDLVFFMGNNSYKINVTSDDRKKLYNEVFRIWSTGRKSVVTIILTYMVIASIWLIRRRTGLMNTINENPYRIVGIFFLIFSILSFAVIIVVNTLTHKIVSRFLPTDVLEIHIGVDSITVNGVEVTKEILKEVFKFQDFLFISFEKNGKVKYIPLPLKDNVSDSINDEIKKCGYEIREIFSRSDLPWHKK